MRISDWSSDVWSSDLSWADDAHVATQHVPELRQLIQPGLADEAPDPGDPVVVFSSPTGHAIALGVGPHATELDDPEELAVFTDAILAVQDRRATARLQPNCQGRQQHERTRHPQDQPSSDTIESRSEERRGGKECVQKGKTRGTP